MLITLQNTPAIQLHPTDDVAIALMLTAKAVPTAPAKSSIGWKISTGLVWLFLLVVAANVVAIIFLEGFAWVLPDDPNGYNLIEQLTGG